MSEDKPGINEGTIKKGGLNERPSSPRPAGDPPPMRPDIVIDPKKHKEYQGPNVPCWCGKFHPRTVEEFAAVAGIRDFKKIDLFGFFKSILADRDREREKMAKIELLKELAVERCRFCKSEGKPDLSSNFALLHPDTNGGANSCSATEYWDRIAKLQAEAEKGREDKICERIGCTRYGLHCNKCGECIDEHCRCGRKG